MTVAEACLREAFDHIRIAQDKMEEAMAHPLPTVYYNRLAVAHKNALLLNAELLIIIPNIPGD